LAIDIEKDDGSITHIPPRAKVRWKAKWETVRRGNVPKTKEGRKKYVEDNVWGKRRRP